MMFLLHFKSTRKFIPVTCFSQTSHKSLELKLFEAISLQGLRYSKNREVKGD